MSGKADDCRMPSGHQPWIVAKEADRIVYACAWCGLRWSVRKPE